MHRKLLVLSFLLIDECSVVIQRIGISMCVVSGIVCIVHGTVCLVHPIWCMGHDTVCRVVFAVLDVGKKCIACCWECM